MGCGGCGKGWASGGGCTAIPILACNGAVGTPDSYIYDIYDRNRGFYNPPTDPNIRIAVVPGRLDYNPAANSASTTAIVATRSQNPVGAQRCTVEVESFYSRKDGTSSPYGIYVGGFWFQVGYRSAFAMNKTVIGVNQDVFSAAALYVQDAPIANNASGAVNMKVVVGPTTTEFYLQGVLIFTQPSAANLLTNGVQLRPMNVITAPGFAGYFTSLKFWGFGLAVNC